MGIRIQLQPDGIQDVTIIRTENDTNPIQFDVLGEDGQPLDMTGGSALISPNEKRRPGPSDSPAFVSNGAITVASISFPITGGDAARTGRLWFNLQFTGSGGEIRTLCRGRLVFDSDITREAEGDTWAPDPAAVDGTPVVIDGSEFWIGFAPGSLEYTYEYNERDTTKVMEIRSSIDFPVPNYIYPLGPESSLQCIGSSGIYDFEAVVFRTGQPSFDFITRLVDEEENSILLKAAVSFTELTGIVAGVEVGTVIGRSPDSGGSIGSAPETLAGWCTLKARFDLDNRIIYGKAWVNATGEQAGWDVEVDAGSITERIGGSSIALRVAVGSVFGQLDLASFSWEKVG